MRRLILGQGEIFFHPPYLRCWLLCPLSCAAAPASAASEAPGLLKEAAKDKKVPSPDLVKALLSLEKASRAGPAPPDAQLLQGLGGTKSPGRMWRLVFTTNGKTVRALSNQPYNDSFARVSLPANTTLTVGQATLH